MPTLLGLPDELLDQIASYKSLVGVSHRLHLVSLRHHYRNIKLTRKNISLFVRTVIENPTLGAFVDSLNVVDYVNTLKGGMMDLFVYTGASSGEDDSEVSSSDEACAEGHPPAVMRAAAQIDPALSAVLERDANAQSALLYLVLWYLPKLHHFDIQIASHKEHFWRACRAAICPRFQSRPTIPPALATLRTATFSWTEDEGGIDLLDVIPFFALPCVTSLTVNTIHASLAHWNIWRNTDVSLLKELQGKGTFSTLKFMGSAVDIPVLADVIRIARPGSLQAFSYEIGGDEVGLTEWDGPAFVAALEPVHETLTSLEVTGLDGLRGDEPPMGSLRAFSALVSLSLDIEYWLDTAALEECKIVDMLPTSLQSLRISMVDGEVECMHAYIIEVVVGISTLKTLRIGSYTGNDGTSQELASACKAADVDLGFFDV